MKAEVAGSSLVSHPKVLINQSKFIINFDLIYSLTSILYNSFMQTSITEQQYREEIKNFIGLSIDKVNILYDPRLHVGGFSLVHIIDDAKKQGQILGLTGVVTYQKNKTIIETNVLFEENSVQEQTYLSQANKIKELILANENQVSSIEFGENSNQAILNFSDYSSLSVQTVGSMKPLTYDNDKEGYSIYFGEQESNRGNSGYFKSKF